MAPDRSADGWPFANVQLVDRLDPEDGDDLVIMDRDKPNAHHGEIFSKLFGSHSAQVRFGLHAPTVGPELLEMAEEFAELKAQAGMATPNLDLLLDCVRRRTVRD